MTEEQKKQEQTEEQQAETAARRIFPKLFAKRAKSAPTDTETLSDEIMEETETDAASEETAEGKKPKLWIRRRKLFGPDESEDDEDEDEEDDEIDEDDEEFEEEKAVERFARIKKIPKNLRSGAVKTRRFAHDHADGIRLTAAAVLTVTMVGQSGILWAKVLDRDSTPKGTLAYGVVRWMNNRTSVRSDVIEPAAYPTKFAARSEYGVYGIQYSADGTRNAWEQTASVWSEALSAAKRVETVTIEEYTHAVKQQMMFVEFDGSVPLQLIAGWIGAAAPDNSDAVTCGGMMISREGEDSYRMFFRDSKTDLIYAAATTLTDVDFHTAAQTFTINDCTMAADTDTVVFPDTLQFAQAQTFDTITLQPYTGGMTGLLRALEMDGTSAQEMAYNSPDKTAVYVGDGSVVRVTQDGIMTYRAEDGIRAYSGSLNKRERELKYAQLGHEISEELLEAMGSGGEVHLTKAYTGEDGRYVTVFSLRIDGVPVDNELGYFARYEYKDGAMVHADAVLRTCTVTGQTVAVMPEKVAASSRQDSTALLSLRYADSAAILRDDTWSAEETPISDDGWVESGEDNAPTADPNLWTDGVDSSMWNDSMWTDGAYTDTSVGSTLNTTGDTVSAVAKWQFLLYHEAERGQDVTQDMNPSQELPDLTVCHMPNFLANLAEGGAIK